MSVDMYEMHDVIIDKEESLQINSEQISCLSKGFLFLLINK